ncbi:elongation factor P maturation arginine rhamnosyltransferase EarP [Neisseria lisongii]|uniref:Protein-arginine rhamnosyltransferase n=1 Tax=Neisseria lisongii TaxID=2912188 RepID=A0AAW5AI93_9NEIS|nr:elongation factor P maturation arginine rhamnosyltransferase EarP [Neisseria lisongii]MCF7528745.1 elongation factor P maturation arginine rhamnosyltransferase EarP [Neisseria lisongii]MCF7529603.1 elongation factor P maturation arginine rhamnosyltransferase EarP [Neisseria lisongii]
MLPKHPYHIWLFCNVIDNYGDIGVSWRLARSLQRELNAEVSLWVDDFAALAALCPDVPPLPCRYQAIHLYRWNPNHAEAAETLPPPDMVIETFACELPENIQQIIRNSRPVWLNWEYLSAEASNERLHLLPSPQAGGIQKYFWFMGFGEVGGGLIRERDYCIYPPDEQEQFRSKINLPQTDTPTWLLFGYRSEIWAKWLEMWRQYDKPMTLLLAGGQIIDSLRQSGCVPPDALQHDGSSFCTGCLTLYRLPFVPQQDFDRLLQFSDGLIVRGEDSFVRAQYAAKPFFWHIYPQDENVHLDKLHAFWRKAADCYAPEISAAHQALSDELNGGITLTAQERLHAWKLLDSRFDVWRRSTETWRDFLFAQPSALEKLAKFISNTLK